MDKVELIPSGLLTAARAQTPPVTSTTRAGPIRKHSSPATGYGFGQRSVSKPAKKLLSTTGKNTSTITSSLEGVSAPGVLSDFNQALDFRRLKKKGHRLWRFFSCQTINRVPSESCFSEGSVAKSISAQGPQRLFLRPPSGSAKRRTSPVTERHFPLLF